MRKLSLVLAVIIAVVLFTGVVSHADENTIYGCYKKFSGRLRIVNSPQQCRPWEVSISWPKSCPHEEPVTDLYVNGATGQDLPDWGLTPENPFKTIAYAIESAPSLRSTPEASTTIHIAPGTYNETITIDIDNIFLEGSGTDTTIIDGQGSSNSVVTIVSARYITVKNLTVQNGFKGIYATRGATVAIEEVSSTNNATDGFQVDLNSNAIFTNCTAQNNGREGIFVFHNSTATLYGTIVANQNQSRGIFSFQSSSIFSAPGASISTIGNNYRGIEVSDSSSLFAYASTIETKDSADHGITIFDSSVLNIYAGATVSAMDNNNRGISIGNTSSFSIIASSVETKNNADTGIGVHGTSRIFVFTGGNVLSHENRNGLEVGTSSSLWISGDSNVTLNNNSNVGLQLTIGASAHIQGTLTTNANGVHGVFCWASASIQLEGVTHIEGNGFNSTIIGVGAIHVTRSSHATLRGEVRILNNTISGLGVCKGSSVDFEDGTFLIKDNGSNGILVYCNAHLNAEPLVSTTFDLQVSNNGSCGININEHSSGHIRSGTTITNNNNVGIVVWSNSQVNVDQTIVTGNGTATGKPGIFVDDGTAMINNSNITGNGASDISATFGSRLTLNGNTIGTISCDGTVLSRGDTICP